ncbi:MAG: translation initiation factor IF-2 N-terminal domain-containing protein, partial [Planctomycetota bacterium]
FAKRLGLPVTDVVKTLFANGVMATINESIDRDTAMLVADEYGATVVDQAGEDVGEITTNERIMTKGSTVRPPVVVVMGHVDHGKTSLLDTIRKTNVVGGESGGITQHIGAYQVRWHSQGNDDRLITFLDTPGHEAFSAMRAHGAALTDVAILVVAADDGVKPQTKEAISHAKAANVPIIVAINKIDVPGADVERAKRELMELELIPEEYGGNTPMVAVSAKQGKNIDALLDVVLLVADIAEPTADPAGELIGTVIEAQQAVGVGVVATILVQSGTLSVGETLVVGGSPRRLAKSPTVITSGSSTVPVTRCF